MMTIIGIFGTVCTVLPMVAAVIWDKYKTNHIDKVNGFS